MEPNDDLKLRGLLKEWTAPVTPSTLEERVLQARRPWWRMMLTGYVRVPVPVVCCLAVLFAAGVWRALRQSDAAPCSAIVVPAADGCRPDTKC